MSKEKSGAGGETAKTDWLKLWSEFRRDITPLAIVVIGGVCLVAALYFVLGSKSSKPFHEIKWNNREMTVYAINEILKTDSLDSFIVRKAAYYTKRNIDSGERKKLTAPFLSGYYKSLMDIRDSARTAPDSAWEYSHAKGIFIRDSIAIFDRIKKGDKYIDMSLTFKTARIPGFEFPFKYRVAIQQVHSDEYLVRYPTLGLWALLIIIQLTLYPLLIVWLVYNMYIEYRNTKVANGRSEKNGGEPKKSGVKYAYKINLLAQWLHVLCPILLCIVAYVLLHADGNTVVKPQYFLFNLDVLFLVVNFLGYLSAGMCLAGMILLHVHIGKLYEQVMAAKMPEGIQKVGDKSDNGGQTETGTALKAASSIVPGVSHTLPATSDIVPTVNTILPSSQEGPEKQQNVVAGDINPETRYRELSATFNSYFMFLALTLTLASLSTNSLFAGLNNLPVVKAISRSQGYNPLPPEFVTLYAILHSAILLAFYVFIKGRLKKLKELLGVTEIDDVNKLTFSQKLMDTLATGGPILAPLLQTIFQQFK